MQSQHLRHQKTICKMQLLEFLLQPKRKKHTHFRQLLQFHGSKKSKQAIKWEDAVTVIIAWEWNWWFKYVLTSNFPGLSWNCCIQNMGRSQLYGFFIDCENHMVYTHASIAGTTCFANGTISLLGYCSTKDQENHTVSATSKLWKKNQMKLRITS